MSQKKPPAQRSPYEYIGNAPWTDDMLKVFHKGDYLPLDSGGTKPPRWAPWAGAFLCCGVVLIGASKGDAQVLPVFTASGFDRCAYERLSTPAETVRINDHDENEQSPFVSARDGGHLGFGEGPVSIKRNVGPEGFFGAGVEDYSGYSVRNERWEFEIVGKRIVANHASAHQNHIVGGGLTRVPNLDGNAGYFTPVMQFGWLSQNISPQLTFGSSLKVRQLALARPVEPNRGNPQTDSGQSQNGGEGDNSDLVVVVSLSPVNGASNPNRHTSKKVGAVLGICMFGSLFLVWIVYQTGKRPRR